MNIVMLSASYYPRTDGVADQVHKIAENMLKQGHNVVLFVLDQKNQVEQKTKGYKVHRFESNKLQTYTDSFFYRTDYPKENIKSILDIFEPDILHVHSPFTMAHWAERIAKDYEIPIVATYHTFMLDHAKLLLKKNIRNGLYISFLKLLLRTFGNFFLNSIFKAANLNIAPSKNVKAFLHKKGINHVETVYNLVEIPEFSKNTEKIQKKFNINADDFVILHVGRLSPEKRIDVLLHVTKQLVEKGYGNKIKVVITSKGILAKELREITKDLNIQDQVIFTGFLNSSDLYTCYSIADIFVDPSIYDTFNICVLEALIMGLPVVGADSKGVGELIENDEVGIAIPSDEKEIEKYAEAIIDLINNPHRLKKLAEKAQTYSKEKYNIKKQVKKLEQLYQNVIDGKYQREKKRLRLRLRYLINHIKYKILLNIVKRLNI